MQQQFVVGRRGVQEPVAAKIRVYELARELGLTNKETLDLCDALGVGVKSHSSSIVDAQADRIRRKADRDGLRRDVQPEEPAPEPKPAGKVIKAGGAPAPAPARPEAPAPLEPAAADAVTGPVVPEPPVPEP